MRENGRERETEREGERDKHNENVVILYEK